MVLKIRSILVENVNENDCGRFLLFCSVFLGSLWACSACSVVRYCSSACNAAAWPAHKVECKRLQAAREERSRVNMVEPPGGS